ncbi:hypothetical protein YN1HA_30370 [Sulfurisphaera ohwakuensis]
MKSIIYMLMRTIYHAIKICERFIKNEGNIVLSKVSKL